MTKILFCLIPWPLWAPISSKFWSKKRPNKISKLRGSLQQILVKVSHLFKPTHFWKRWINKKLSSTSTILGTISIIFTSKIRPRKSTSVMFPLMRGKRPKLLAIKKWTMSGLWALINFSFTPLWGKSNNWRWMAFFRNGVLRYWKGGKPGELSWKIGKLSGFGTTLRRILRAHKILR